MTLTGIHKNTYQLGKSVGRGGEGEVFEVLGDDRLLAKVYHDKLGQQKEEKLRTMVGMWNLEMERYISWPSDFCTDESTGRQAIVIKKLVSCVALHQVISPMDRKKIFPDKSYSFLIHIARNLAVALHKIHEMNLVVGDINEGNILVNKQGFVYFIDCDSFQLKKGNAFFPCDVGVPRYTPPEILNAGSFKNAVRNFNTDNFSLAVLIFQLLFLGKHPFAGAPLGGEKTIDDEETAIKHNQFAYSLRNKDKKIAPPKGSLPITALPKKIVSCFHESFETQDSRPSSAEWAVTLDGLAKSLSHCQNLKTHSYPSHMHECPWCALNNTLGIDYFHSGTVSKETKFIQDIDRYIYGLELQFLHLPTLPANVVPPSDLSENLDHKLISKTLLTNHIFLFCAFAALGVAFYSVYALLAVPLFLALIKNNQMSLKVRKHLNVARYNAAHARNTRRQIAEKYGLIHELNEFNKLVIEIKKHVEDYKKLYDRSLKIQTRAEEKVYSNLMRQHLEAYTIADYKLINIADVSKNLLIRHGIKTANDIPRLRGLTIRGLAPYIQQSLVEWHRSLVQKFNYIPNETVVKKEMETIYVDMVKEKQKLEYDIKDKYKDADLNRNVAIQKAETVRIEYSNVCIQELQLNHELKSYSQIMAMSYLVRTFFQGLVLKPFRKEKELSTV